MTTEVYYNKNADVTKITDMEIKEGLKRTSWRLVDEVIFSRLFKKCLSLDVEDFRYVFDDSDKEDIDLISKQMKMSLNYPKGKFNFINELLAFNDKYLISEHKCLDHGTLFITLTKTQIESLSDENKDKELEFMLKKSDNYKLRNFNIENVLDDLIVGEFPKFLMEEISLLEDEASAFFRKNGDEDDLSILSDVFEYLYDSEAILIHFASEYSGNILIDSVNKIKERYPNNAYLEKSKKDSESACYDLIETISNHL